MTKALRKAIMRRSKLKNDYNKNRSYENWNSYKKQRNFCVKLLRKTKSEYYKNIDIKSLSDNKKFWRTIKPYFSNKGLNKNQIFLSEKGKLLDDPIEVASTLNDHFINITKTLDLKDPSEENPNDTSEYNISFDNHLSALKIRTLFSRIPQKFDFKRVSKQEVKQEILCLDSKKSSIYGDIPVSTLKQYCNVYVELLTDIINDCLLKGVFPDELKKAEVTPIFKKIDCLNKENYRPISLLPYMSKVFERIIYKQLVNFFKDKLSDTLTGFRKNHSTQHSLLIMIESLI